MKRFAAYCLLPVLMLVTACTTAERGESPEEWTKEEVNEWFERGEWLGETEMRPDTTIDKRELVKRYHENERRWDTAFDFIRKGDFVRLSAGEHLLDGKDVFVKVTEYNSKDPEDVFYESHKNYADIQFVVSGMEYIGRSDLKGAEVRTPYNEEKDIEFYNASDGKNLLAKPGTFFIFFPGEGHCPGMKVNDNAPVKKIVIKVHV